MGIVNSKRPFTLLELIICFALIAILGSYALFQAKPMLDHYRFTNSTKRLKEELLRSKHLAIAINGDITFHIHQERNKLVCERKTDEVVRLHKIFNTPMDFPLISQLQFEGEITEDITFTFYRSGWHTPQGTLSLQSGSNHSYCLDVI